MKKSIAVLLMIGLVAAFAAAPAQAKKKKKKPKAPVKVERVVEYEYSLPGIGAAGAGGFCPFDLEKTQEQQAPVCLEFPLEAGELYVKVEVADMTGGSVAGYVSQGDTDGDGVGNLYGDFCTAHSEPIEMLSTTVPLRVSFYPGATPDCAPSTPTQGTIKITFSNMP